MEDMKEQGWHPTIAAIQLKPLLEKRELLDAQIALYDNLRETEEETD